MQLKQIKVPANPVLVRREADPVPCLHSLAVQCVFVSIVRASIKNSGG